jgi:mono/diheme cytochrome c family protein
MKSLVRITTVLISLGSASVAIADDAATSKVFGEQCAMCHGPDGKAQSFMGKKDKVKDWGDGKTLNVMSDADVTKMIRVGKDLMPAFTSLTDEQVKALVGYVRTFQK